MPRYDYVCPENGRVIEVTHRMDEHIRTWGELCEAAECDAGQTPLGSPVEKQLSTGTRVESSGGTRGVSLPTSCGCGKPHGCGGH